MSLRIYADCVNEVVCIYSGTLHGSSVALKYDYYRCSKPGHWCLSVFSRNRGPYVCSQVILGRYRPSHLKALGAGRFPLYSSSGNIFLFYSALRGRIALRFELEKTCSSTTFESHIT